MWQVAADIAALAVNVVASLTDDELRVLPLSISLGFSPLGFSLDGHQRAQHVAAEGVRMATRELRQHFGGGGCQHGERAGGAAAGEGAGGAAGC
jgi:hypothetical protein